MGLGEFSDCDMPIAGTFGADIIGESQITHLPVPFEEPLVSCWFPLFALF
jgi:hypothetical protein